MLIVKSTAHCVVAIILLVATHSVSAESSVAAELLTFDQALRLALSSPAITANKNQIEAAQFSAIPAGKLPDPSLILGIDKLPINTADQFSFTKDFMTMRRIGVMQEFPNRAKRQARIAVAKEKILVSQTEQSLTQRLVLKEAASAWIARYTLEQQLIYLDALVNENNLFSASVQAKIKNGSASVADAINPQEEFAEIIGRRDLLNARLIQSKSQLYRWIGAAANAPLAGHLPDWPIAQEDLLAHLHQHPDLAILQAKSGVVEAEIAEARAEKKSDWALTLAYQQRGPQLSDMMSAEVSIDLPIFSGSRQNPKIAAKLAERSALTAEREMMLREHEATLRADFSEYQRLNQSVVRQAQVLLPLANKKIQLMQAAWRSGKTSLTELSNARRTAIEAHLILIELMGQRAQLLAQLNLLYGNPALMSTTIKVGAQQ